MHRDFFDVGADVHYGASIESRFVSGGFMELGPAVVWLRTRVPLVAGEEPSPLTRVPPAHTVIDQQGSGLGASHLSDMTGGIGTSL